MATVAQIRAAVAEFVDYALEAEPVNIERRCDVFASFLSGWLAKGEPAISGELRRLQGRPDPVDGA